MCDNVASFLTDPYTPLTIFLYGVSPLFREGCHEPKEEKGISRTHDYP